jgi:hypothetical protein
MAGKRKHSKIISLYKEIYKKFVEQPELAGSGVAADQAFRGPKVLGDNIRNAADPAGMVLLEAAEAKAQTILAAAGIAGVYRHGAHLQNLHDAIKGGTLPRTQQLSVAELWCNELYKMVVWALSEDQHYLPMADYLAEHARYALVNM